MYLQVVIIVILRSVLGNNPKITRSDQAVVFRIILDLGSTYTFRSVGTSCQQEIKEQLIVSLPHLLTGLRPTSYSVGQPQYYTDFWKLHLLLLQMASILG